ncbi:MAG: bifunctional 2-C-methyl-D-erythritol 4-phosphate cytidylyltransferase/2-C-methyl-D-erythritol 2,4-cyclodiphosphate synthase [Pseudomonadota bacterium]
MHVTALVVAAGRGERVGAPERGPKQYRLLGGRTVLAWTMDAFRQHTAVDDIQVVIHAEDHALYAAAVRDVAAELRPVAIGGATRQASVHAGLEAVAASATPPDVVLIHDAARPFVTAAEITAVIDGIASGGGAISALPVVDTLKRARPDAHGPRIETTVPRDNLWRALTPQAFRLDDILNAHRAAVTDGRADLTDDAGIAEASGLTVRLVAGDAGNTKITSADDLADAEKRLMTSPADQPANTSGLALPDVRSGTGFDVHRFADGTSVWLCGVEIPHDQRLDGHSDADVGLHALTDALLGAIGDGDIGAHFPPSDPQWKGAASDQFLADAARRVRARGGVITNVDVTLLCEAPKVGPHRDAMRRAVADILAIDVARVGVKATTTEQLGFTGRREGIAAMATATVVLGMFTPA